MSSNRLVSIHLTIAAHLPTHRIFLCPRSYQGNIGLVDTSTPNIITLTGFAVEPRVLWGIGKHIGNYAKNSRILFQTILAVDD